MPTQVQPATRLQHPDQQTNRIVQDLYDKLQQLQQDVAKLKEAAAVKP